MVPHKQDVASDGTVEEPVGRILDAVDRAVDQVLERAGAEAADIAAVGMDVMASTILGVDDDGAPLTPVYTYADTRCAEDVERLKRRLDVDAAYQRTGVMQHTSYVPGRVLWLQRTAPDIAGRVARWLDASTFIYTRWFGKADVPCSYSVASWSGLLDRHRLEWDTELLRQTGLTAAKLPALKPYSHSLSGLTGAYATRWPRLANIPFFLAVGDGAAVNVGAGCAGPSAVALTVGTTSAMRMLRWDASPDVPRGLWAYRLGERGTLLGGAFSEGGLLIDWALKTLRLPPLDRLDEALSQLPPDGHGLTVLPFLAGERATGWSNRATGVFEGLRASTTPLEMLQAALEAVTYRFATVAGLLVGSSLPNVRFAASGGAIRRSKWWLQTMADSLGATISVSSEEQETSRGAAVLALHSLGVWDGLDTHVPEVRDLYHPRPERVKQNRAAGERQKDLYTRVLGDG